jgi:hypothetical protein
MVFEGPTQIPATHTERRLRDGAKRHYHTSLATGWDYCALDFGLRVNPEASKCVLQEAVEAWEASVGTVFLGYDLCFQAVAGSQASNRTFVAPKVKTALTPFQAQRRPKTHSSAANWEHPVQSMAGSRPAAGPYLKG